MQVAADDGTLQQLRRLAAKRLLAELRRAPGNAELCVHRREGWRPLLESSGVRMPLDFVGVERELALVREPPGGRWPEVVGDALAGIQKDDPGSAQ